MKIYYIFVFIVY